MSFRAKLYHRLSSIDLETDLRHGDHDLNPGTRLPQDQPIRPAAVLVPIIDRPDGKTVLLTKRTAHLNAHAGQISFPGGQMEDGDSGPEATALRETHEETGVDPRLVDIVGRLDNYATVTGFAVTPVVGIVAPTVELTPDPFEVEEAFEVPLSFLMDPANHKRHSGFHNGRRRYWYAMPYRGYYIWGATAGMLRNLYRRAGDLC